MRVFLSGPMGSGKSTLCKTVADRLSLPAFDLDALIVERAGAPVPELFRRLGEAGFRQEERATLEHLLDHHEHFVVSLGGGTVTQPELRRRMLREGTLVTLMADPAELARRVGADAGRPLLADGEPEQLLRRILADRAAAYAECHAQLRTDRLNPTQIADEIVRLVSEAPIAVPLGERTYRVEVGAGLRARVASYVALASSVVVVTDETVAPLWADALVEDVKASGKRVTKVVLPPGEPSKHSGSVQKIWDSALTFGIDRHSWVVGVGGGVVGDMAGFAAATLLRGIPIGHVPTTLLSMVDSAVGGKTGFDTPHGKNLVGAFHQPGFVLADIEVLSTLEDRDYRAGLAEVVKSAWIDSEASVAMLERDADGLMARDQDALLRAIRMSCNLKGRIVTEDEREAGVRAFLNFGHTVGHAIEAAQGYGDLRHGEAVALGMVAACRLAVKRGRLPQVQADRVRGLLERLGLPVDVDAYLDDRTLAFAQTDKKRTGDLVGFVVPGLPGDMRVERMSFTDMAVHVRP